MTSVPTDRDIRDLTMLEALYEASEGGTRDVDAEALKDHVEDHAERYAWLAEQQRQGTVRSNQSLTPRFRITEEGIRLVDRARQARQDRTQRRTACRSRLLAWTDHVSEHADDFHNALSFPRAAHGWFHGERFQWHEVVAAAEDLSEAGLIETRPKNLRGSTAPRIDTAITERGQECLDKGGDVAAYTAEARQSGHSIYIAGDVHALSAALGANSTATTTVTTLSVDAAVLLAQAFRQAMPSLGLEGEEAEQALQDIEQRDDQGRVKRGLSWLGRFANDSSTGALGSVLGTVALNLLGG